MSMWCCDGCVCHWQHQFPSGSFVNACGNLAQENPINTLMGNSQQMALTSPAFGRMVGVLWNPMQRQLVVCELQSKFVSCVQN